MAGIYTQRRIPQKPLNWSFVRAGFVDKIGTIGYPDSVAGVQVPYQSTTSFRSGGRWDESIPTYDSLASEDRGFNSYDTGHPFTTTRTEYRFSHPDFDLRNSTGTIRYRGPLIPDSRNQQGGGVDYLSIAVPTDLNDFGRKAIKLTVPTSPVAGLAAFAGELRERLPSVVGLNLMRNRAGTFRELGGEYLNVQFGWKPFVKDLQKILDAVIKSDKIISQYARDSGRMVRRRFDFPVTQSTEMFPPTQCLPRNIPNSTAWNPLFANVIGSLTELQETERSIWFSGAYTYYLSEPSGWSGRLHRYEQLANKVLGTRLTPDVLWQLAPWSWLADWLADIGVSVANATSFSSDRLVIRYGYLMCRTRTRRVTTVRSVQPLVGSCGNLVAEFQNIRKERIKATPYGFGLNTEAFTPSQWAILAALGMTKAPKILR